MRELCAIEKLGLFAEDLAAVNGGIDKPGGNCVGNCLQDHQIAETA